MTRIGNVGQLREAIEGLPDHADVCIDLDEAGYSIDQSETNYVEVAVCDGSFDGETTAFLIISVGVTFTEEAWE